MKYPGFTERLSLALDKAGFPPKNRGRIQRLADMMDLTHRGASKWLNGQSGPPAKKYPILAKKLQVNLKWLETGIGDPAEQTGFSDHCIQNVPIFMPHQLSAPEKQPLYFQPCYLPSTLKLFGIRLQTEAMSPRFPVDSTIIFEETTQVKEGDYILINDPMFPEPLFRQLFVSHEAQYLMAHHPKFERITLNEDHRILGRLVQAVIQFQ